MNKEVNYVLQGFLLTLLVIGAIRLSGFLLSLPVHEDANNNTSMAGMCGNAPDPEDPVKFSKGKTIFMDNCASCHSLRRDLTGPALAGVHQRITDKKLLYKWIRNPSAVLKSGNGYFNSLQKRFGGALMTGFPGLSDDEINAVLTYIEENSK